MAAVSPHQVQLCHLKSNTMLPDRKYQHSQFLQCRRTEIERSITEQHGYNSWSAQFIHLWTDIGVEFTQCLRRTHSTIVLLICNLFYPPSQLSFFFLISPFNTVIYILFRYETRRLVFPYLLFLCLFLPAPIPFTHTQHRYIISLYISPSTNSIPTHTAPLHYISLYFSHHQFHSHTHTAPFHFITGPVRLQIFFFLIFVVRLFKPSLAVLRYGLLHIPFV